MQNNSVRRTALVIAATMLSACRQPSQSSSPPPAGDPPAASPAADPHAPQESGRASSSAAQTNAEAPTSRAIRPTDESIRDLNLVAYWPGGPEDTRVICEDPSVVNALFLILPHPMEDVVQHPPFRRIQERRLEAFRLAVEIAPPDMLIIPLHRPIAAYGYKGRFSRDQFYDPDFWKGLVERARDTERELLERGRKTWRGLDVEFYGDGEEFKRQLDRARLMAAMSDTRGAFDVGMPTSPFGGVPEYGWMTQTLCKRIVAPTYYRERMVRTPRDQIAQLVVNKTGKGPDGMSSYTPEQAVQTARERGNVLIYCGDKDAVAVARRIVEASRQ